MGAGPRMGRQGSQREDLREAEGELNTCQTSDGDQLVSAYCVLRTMLCFFSFKSMRMELLLPLFYR